MGSRVLLVEDNPDMRAFIRGLVETVPSFIHECADGEGAVSAYGVLRTIDADAHVVIVPAHGEVEYRRAAAEAGACAYVLKEKLLDLPGILDGTVPLPEPQQRQG